MLTNKQVYYVSTSVQCQGERLREVVWVGQGNRLSLREMLLQK